MKVTTEERLEVPKSILIKRQVKTFEKTYKEDGKQFKIIAHVKHDDEYGNGHNTFSVTGTISQLRNGRFIEENGGCIHEEIAKHFPELKPLIKYHLMSTDEPMYYIQNTMYHAKEHGVTHAWVYYTHQDYLKIGKPLEQLLGYIPAIRATQAEGHEGYRVVWDTKTIKVRDLEAARHTAIWPDATDKELTSPALETLLRTRLPKLMKEFETAVTSLGFVY